MKVGTSIGKLSLHMNRIVEKFAALKRAGKKSFVVYIGAGDPNLEATRQLALAFDKAGVDILELGVPFSAWKIEWRIQSVF